MNAAGVPEVGGKKKEKKPSKSTAVAKMTKTQNSHFGDCNCTNSA